LWAATDETRVRPVLVRLLETAPSDEEAFEEHARARSQIQHPGVVTLLEWGFVTDDRGARRAYHVFETVPTTTLASRLAGNDPPPWPTRRALLFTADVAGTLAELHELGIVAGSLAPSRVLIDEAGRPKLLDVGLGPSGGAPADDVHALGGLLHLLLTGEPSTKGARVVAGEGIDPAVAGLLAGMLAEDPARRPPSARAVAGRLRALADELARRRTTVVAGEEVVEEANLTRGPRIGFLVPLVLLAMVAAGVGAAYALTHDDDNGSAATVSTTAPVPTAPAPAVTVTVTTTLPPTESVPTETGLTTATAPTDTATTETTGVPTATNTATVTSTVTTTTETTATVTTETTTTATTGTETAAPTTTG
jgi:serine/threonine-protein kinase